MSLLLKKMSKAGTNKAQPRGSSPLVISQEVRKRWLPHVWSLPSRKLTLPHFTSWTSLTAPSTRSTAKASLNRSKDSQEAITIHRPDINVLALNSLWPPSSLTWFPVLIRFSRSLSEGRGANWLLLIKRKLWRLLRINLKMLNDTKCCADLKIQSAYSKVLEIINKLACSFKRYLYKFQNSFLLFNFLNIFFYLFYIIL